MTSNQDLPSIRNQLYERAENWWTLSVWLGFLLQISALGLIFFRNDAWVAVGAGAGIFVPIGVTWLRYGATKLKGRADKCRRLVLYADGLGQDIRPDELAEVRGWAEGDLTEAPFSKPYYSSTLEPGPRRLLDITAEACFFTYRLADLAARQKLLVFCLSIAFVLAILYVSIESASSGLVVIVARAALATISLLVSGDLLLLWREYSDLASASKNSFHECARLRTDQDVTNKQAHQAVEDYHLKLAQSPPIPRRLYRKHLRRLNDIYRQSHEVRSDG